MVGVLTEANDHAVCELSLVGKDKQSKGDKQQADDQRLLESSLTQLPSQSLVEPARRRRLNTAHHERERARDSLEVRPISASREG